MGHVANDLEEFSRAEERAGTPVLEWVAAAVGAIIVLGLLGFTSFAAFRDDSRYPDVAVKSISVLPVSSGYLVTIEATNIGGSTAAALVIEGVLKKGDRDLETSTVTFDYLPSHSVREGGLFFRRNPSEGVLELRPTGYQNP